MKNCFFYFCLLKSLSFSFNRYIPIACRDGYYYDRYKNKCIECRKECYKCSEHGLFCKKCSSGQYIVDHVYKNCIKDCEVCVNNYACKKCKNGYFINPSNKCQHCNLSNCKVCENEYTCKTWQGEGIILDNYSGKCVKCDDNCLHCLNPTKCNSCLRNFGFDIITQKCVKCGYRCNKCKGKKCIGL